MVVTAVTSGPTRTPTYGARFAHVAPPAPAATNFPPVARARPTRKTVANPAFDENAEYKGAQPSQLGNLAGARAFMGTDSSDTARHHRVLIHRFAGYLRITQVRQLSCDLYLCWAAPSTGASP